MDLWNVEYRATATAKRNARILNLSSKRLHERRLYSLLGACVASHLLANRRASFCQGYTLVREDRNPSRENIAMTLFKHLFPGVFREYVVHIRCLPILIHALTVLIPASCYVMMMGRH